MCYNFYYSTLFLGILKYREPQLVLVTVWNKRVVERDRMPMRIQVKMTKRKLQDFSLYYTYTRVGSIICTALAGVLFGIGIPGGIRGNYLFALVCTVGAFVFILIPLFSLKNKVEKIVLNSGGLKGTIDYELAGDGIVMSQGSETTQYNWEQLLKATATNNSIIVYVTKEQVLVFPKKDLDEQYTAVVQIISTHIPPSKVNFRTVH